MDRKWGSWLKNNKVHRCKNMYLIVIALSVYLIAFTNRCSTTLLDLTLLSSPVPSVALDLLPLPEVQTGCGTNKKPFCPDCVRATEATNPRNQRRMQFVSPRLPTPTTTAMPSKVVVSAVGKPMMFTSDSGCYVMLTSAIDESVGVAMK